MRVCAHCQQLKNADAFGTRNGAPRGTCLTCVSAQSRAASARYREAHPDRVRELNRKYSGMYAASHAKARKKWKVLNPDSVRKEARERQRCNVARLADSYIKGVLTARTTLQSSDIPPELVALKREQLSIRRALKQLGAALTEGEPT